MTTKHFFLGGVSAIAAIHLLQKIDLVEVNQYGPLREGRQ